MIHSEVFQMHIDM